MKIIAVWLVLVGMLSGCGSDGSAPAGSAQGDTGQAISCPNSYEPAGPGLDLSQIVDGTPGTYEMKSFAMFAVTRFTDVKRAGFVYQSTLPDGWSSDQESTTYIADSHDFSCSDFTQLHSGSVGRGIELPGVIDRASGKISADLKFTVRQFKCTQSSCGPDTESVVSATPAYGDAESFLGAPRPGHDFAYALEKPDGSTMIANFRDHYTDSQKGYDVYVSVQAVYGLK